jgi:hypothetical protein
VELVGVGGDQPEMRKIANQTTLGYRSCVYCLVRGSYQESAVKFGLKHHEDPQRERTPEHRYNCARLVKQMNAENPELNADKQNRIHGIMGNPLFKESRSFYGSYSYVLDMMHVVLLGFLRDILEIMCVGSSKPHHFQRSSTAGFKGNECGQSEPFCRNRNICLFFSVTD